MYLFLVFFSWLRLHYWLYASSSGSFVGFLYFVFSFPNVYIDTFYQIWGALDSISLNALSASFSPLVPDVLDAHVGQLTVCHNSFRLPTFCSVPRFLFHSFFYHLTVKASFSCFLIVHCPWYPLMFIHIKIYYKIVFSSSNV